MKEKMLQELLRLQRQLDEITPKRKFTDRIRQHMRILRIKKQADKIAKKIKKERE